MTKRIFKNKYLLSLVIFIYIISNTIIFNLIDKSKYQKKLYVCEKNVILKLNYFIPLIKDIINEVNDEMNFSNGISLENNVLKIRSNNKKKCEDLLKKIEKATSFKLNNVLFVTKLSSKYFEHNINVNFNNNEEFINRLAMLELHENGYKLIDIEVKDIQDRFIDNTLYNIVVYILFNFILTLFFISMYVFYKKSKLFDSKTK